MTRHFFPTPALAAEIPASIEAPALARRRIDAWLPATVSERDRGALRLLVSELVTNAVRHAAAGGAVVRLHAAAAPEGVRVQVCDRGRGFSPGRPAPRGSEGGYGLFLVERIAERWGVDTGDGTRVWFELPLAPPGAS